MVLQFIVPDMACSACSTSIVKAVQTLDAAATVSADLQTKRVTIETQHPEAEVKRAIVEAGYSPQ